MNLKVKFTKALFLLGLLLAHMANAQERTIVGTVHDPEGVPLPGVNILVQGTLRGTQTDFDGRFQLIASTGDVLIFTYVGMEDQSVAVGTMDRLNVIMQYGNELDEVIVVAYGNQTRKSLVGSIASLGTEKIESQ